MECLLPYFCTYGDCTYLIRIMVGLEKMLDYRGVGLARFHYIRTYLHMYVSTSNTYVLYIWHSLNEIRTYVCTYIYLVMKPKSVGVQ